MKKLLLTTALSCIALLYTSKASAQFAYNFTRLVQPYASLQAFTSVSNNSLWTADSTFTVPIGFNFKLAGTTIDKVYLTAGNNVSATKATAKQSGFVMLGAALMDRGQNWMTARSDIRYLTSGVTGSRVFKLEIYNAGFEDEYFNTGELKDSISLQLWLFEGTNIVEFHYGTSMVSDFNGYFGGLMLSGYLKNIDTATGAFEKFYVVKGSPAAPTIDSMTSFANPKGLSSVPASGTVFRFIPKSNVTTGVHQVAPGELAKVYPTQFSGTINIAHSNAHPLNYAVISIAGQVVSQGVAAGGRTTIDLSGIAAGTYTIRLADEAAHTYEGQKIIKL